MYVSDGTKFEHTEFGEVVAVGWLGTEGEFCEGPVSDAEFEELARRCFDPDRYTRGFHQCPFCESPPRLGGADFEWGDRVKKLGSAEILVKGTVDSFVAPNLIIHYVVEHGYKPPDPFLEALVKDSKR